MDKMDKKDKKDKKDSNAISAIPATSKIILHKKSSTSSEALPFS